MQIFLDQKQCMHMSRVADMHTKTQEKHNPRNKEQVSPYRVPPSHVYIDHRFSGLSSLVGNIHMCNLPMCSVLPKTRKVKPTYIKTLLEEEEITL